jgi:phage-related protein
MLERLKYKNHLNEAIDFGKDGIFVNINDLHDYEWTITKKSDKIAAFSRGVTTKKLPIVIICDTEENGTAARNKLMEVVEKDVLAFSPGQIILGDYHFKCYVTKSEKKNYLATKRLMEVTLTLTSDFPYWIKEKTFSFGASAATAPLGNGLDYPHGYPFDYTKNATSTEIINNHFVAANFKMIIYGAVDIPTVVINDHIYKVNCTINEGEYLTIDSAAKKIFKTGMTGEITNLFSRRNRESYVFEKIPVGVNAVSWSGEFGFDIILMEERSEPKWT